MRSFGAGAMTSRISVPIPSSAIGLWPTSWRRNSYGSCPSRRIPSRPRLSARWSPGRRPYVRFDRNSYSIPHTHVRRPLTLLASPTTVRVIAGPDEIARHPRSYDTGEVIEQEAHVAALVAATRQANPSSARDRLRLAVPAAATLLERLAARGESLRYQ